MEHVALNEQTLSHILENVKNVSIGVLGDVCLDIYWIADMTRSKLSRETPHFPLPIVQERITPGAAGNVVMNMKDLGANTVYVLSAVGHDWRGRLLLDILEAKGIDTSYIVQSDDMITPSYCKPVRKGISPISYEDPRLDFENAVSLSTRTADELCRYLDDIAGKVQALVVTDQFLHGVVTEKIRKKLSDFSKKGLKVIVDSREKLASYEHVIIKPNEVEAAALIGVPISQGAVMPERYAPIAKALYKKSGKPVIITLGDKGALYFDGMSLYYACAANAGKPIDTVGAGDTFVSAFCCAMAACGDGGQALAFANLAACVTVSKCGTTGTASPDEIWHIYKGLMRK